MEIVAKRSVLKGTTEALVLDKKRPGPGRPVSMLPPEIRNSLLEGKKVSLAQLKASVDKQTAAAEQIA
jgi:hypothetical protein